jgi:hypothetical protein
MEKISPSILDCAAASCESRLEEHPTPEPDIQIDDQRVAKLLLVLSDLDEFFGGVEGLEQAQLRDLIWNALPACGFVDSTEAHYAIAAVLRIIEGPDPPRDGLRKGTRFPSDGRNIRWFSPC